MLLNGKTIDAIDESDLLALIGEEESRTLDFKGHGYRYKDKADEKWKGELWIDVSSFANAVGGWIICGMTDKEGKADELCGLGTIDPDLERRRLEQCIKSGIEPQIPGVQVRVKELPNTGKGKAIVIYVPRSFAAPHRVKETRKFHVRRSNWNDEMNIDEVRTAFNLSESYVERIRQFRRDRISVIAIQDHEDIPVPLDEGVRIVQHIVPLSFSNSSGIVDLTAFQNRYPAKWLLDNNLINYVNYGRFNFEGFVRPSSTGSRHRGYMQIFRNGTIECVDVCYETKERMLDLRYVESEILSNLREAWIIQQNLGVETPLIVMISVLGIRGRWFAIQTNGFYEPRDDQPPINQDKLLVPEIVVESYGQDGKASMRFAFDVLWNTGGWQRSFSYDENGNWVRKDY